MTGYDGLWPVRVLIADDDPRVRAALRSFLAASPGFHVTGEADTADMALDLAREQAPAVALVDVLLPTAPEGLGLLRALANDLRIPAIAMSMRSGLRGQALAAGAYQFLEKGCPPELLLAALHATALSTSRPVKPGPPYPNPR